MPWDLPQHIYKAVEGQEGDLGIDQGSGMRRGPQKVICLLK